MAAHGLPVLPGTGILRSDEEALAAVDGSACRSSSKRPPVVAAAA